MRNADWLLFNQAVKLCSPWRAYTFIGVLLIHIALTRRHSFRYSVWCIPVNLQYILILGERCNLLSCPGHLRIKNLRRNNTVSSTFATKLAKYLVSLTCVRRMTHDLQRVFLYSFMTQTGTLLQRQSVSLAWRLDREMRRRLILHETGFTR